MSSFFGYTLEDFLEDQCGMVTPKLLELFEPHREFVELKIEQWYDEHDEDGGEPSWRAWSSSMWLYLPDPNNDCFEP